MQSAILVKNGSDVLAKLVYSGNDLADFMEAEMDRLEAKYPSYTFTYYASDMDSAFTSATVNTPAEII